MIATSLAQAHTLWRLRETLSEVQKQEGASIKHDVAVPVSAMAAFIESASRAVSAALPGIRPVAFGHIGDGNVHFNVMQPDGADVPGSPLLVAKNASVATNLDLTWSASCALDADDYAVHEGPLGSWYTHGPETCSTAGALSHTLTPDTGGQYYLVVPLSPDAEGSYGTDSSDVERPVGQSTCRASGVIDPCP